MAESRASADAVTVVQFPPLGDINRTDTKPPREFEAMCASASAVRERGYKVTSLVSRCPEM